MKDFPVYLGLGAALLLGLAIFSLGARNIRRAWASRHWPTVSATVVESSTASDAAGPRASTSGVIYTANIKFQYDVKGRTHKTDQIWFGQTVGSGDSSEAELRRFRYPLGRQVTVWYDPADPSIASVNPGFQAEVMWLPGAGLAFLVPTLMAYIVYRSSNTPASGMTVAAAIFALVFMTIGAIILFFGGRSLLRGWQSQTWPTTRGVIVYGQIDQSLSTSHTSDGEYTTAAYGAPLIYRYEVDGRLHYSNTRCFGQLAGSDAEWASHIADLYRLGREVTVAYRPDAPDIAALETGITNDAWWAPGAGAAFFLFGLAALLFIVPAMNRF